MQMLVADTLRGPGEDLKRKMAILKSKQSFKVPHNTLLCQVRTASPDISKKHFNTDKPGVNELVMGNREGTMQFPGMSESGSMLLFYVIFYHAPNERESHVIIIQPAIIGEKE